jgi:CheY-like chemotaxis protein
MKHILIIDDDPAILILFEEFLKSKGYATSAATNGKQGLEMLEQQKPDLIITDIMMPEMDGREMIHEVRQRQPDLPIIAISGGVKRTPMFLLTHAKKSGACRIFNKPIELAEMLKAVQELLSETS